MALYNKPDENVIEILELRKIEILRERVVFYMAKGNEFEIAIKTKDGHLHLHYCTDETQTIKICFDFIGIKNSFQQKPIKIIFDAKKKTYPKYCTAF